MRLSHAAYTDIVERQLNGDLTMIIDTSGFRRLLYRADPDKFANIFGRPVAGTIRAIKVLSVLDFLVLLAAMSLAIHVFRLWAFLVIPGLLIAWIAYRSIACRGRQSLTGVSFVLGLALVVAIWFGNWSVWTRVFIVAMALAFFLTRLLYVVTSRLVFSLAHSSYEFFAAFYMQPEGAPMPLLWTNPEINT